MAPRVISAASLSLEVPKDVRDLLLHYYSVASLEQILHALTLPPNETTIRVDDLLRSDMRLDVDSLLVTIQKAAGSKDLVTQLPDLPEAIVICHSVGVCGSQPADVQVGEDVAGSKVVVVDRMCGEAVLRGSDVFAPGVLGCSSGLVSGVDVEVLVDCKGGFQRASSPEAFEGELVRVGRGVAEMSRKGMDADGQKGVAVRMLVTEFGPTLPSFARIQSALAPLVAVASSQSLPSMVGSARQLCSCVLGSKA